MADGFLDVFTDLVTGAGRATASTSVTWATWAGNVESQLRAAAGGAGDAVVSAAFEDYLSVWNPQLRSLAENVDALGGNTVAGAGVIAGADADSTAFLARDRAVADTRGTLLNRPIEG